MEVYFKGVRLFPGSVVRVTEAPRGLETFDRTRLAPPAGGSQLLGTAERRVVLGGRLVGESEGELHAQLEAALELVNDPPVAGELLVADRSLGELCLIRAGLCGTVDRGRVRSAAFEAVFGDITILDKE